MKNLLILLISVPLLWLANSCKDETGRSLFGGYADGTYCAEVTYYNPNTGTNSTYTLRVEVEDNFVVAFYWPNGGWLDSDHFTPEELDSDGYCSFESDQGYEYTVTIIGTDCDFTDETSFLQDLNSDQEAITCGRCGDTKDADRRYCDSCTDEIENTCRRCGDYEYGMDDGLCSRCTNQYCQQCGEFDSWKYWADDLCSNCQDAYGY
jgi:hypothetical protein